MEKESEKLHPAIKARTERVNLLLSKIKQQKKVELNQLIASFSMETGLSFRKIREYLETLEATKKIRVVTVNDILSKDYGAIYIEYVEE